MTSNEEDDAAFVEVDVLTDPPSEDADVLHLRYSLS